MITQYKQQELYYNINPDTAGTRKVEKMQKMKIIW